MAYPNYFIAGVMTADLFDGDTLFSRAKTLIDSSITIGVESVDVRGSTGHKLFGKYFHTSKFDMKFTNAMWKLDYIAKNIGSAITIGGDAMTNESVVLGSAASGTVSATPVDFGTYGTIGWVSLPNAEDWQKVTFTGKNFTSPVGTQGDTVCVKFMSTDAAARKLTVSSNIIPDTIHVIGKVGLFAGDASNPQSATRVGYVQFEIPRFLLNGSQEIGMSSTGASNTPLSGSALSTESTDCDGEGYYAIITELIDNANWYDNVTDIYVADDDTPSVAVSGTTTLDVWAVTNDHIAFKPPVADLTFASGTTAKATIGAHTGVITGVATGTSVITVSITNKNTITTDCTVTVTA